MRSLPGRLRVLPAVGEGIRLAFARIFVAWPVAFAASLVPLATWLGWQRLAGAAAGSQFFAEHRALERGAEMVLTTWSIALPPLLAAALLAGTIVRTRRRQPIEVGRSLMAGARRAGAPLLVAAALSLVAGLCAASSVAMAGAGGLSPGSLVFNVVWFLVVVAIVARVAVAPAAAAAERLGPRAACRRSMALLAGHAWRMSGVVLLALIAWTALFRGVICRVLLSAVLQVFQQFEPGEAGAPPPSLTDAFIVAEVDATFTLFAAVVLVVVFDRARELREGMPIDELESTFA